MSKIDDLASSIGKIFPERADENGTKWMSDHKEWVRALMRNVQPLPDSRRLLVAEALAEWNEKEKAFLNAYGSGKTRSEFLDESRRMVDEVTATGEPLNPENISKLEWKGVLNGEPFSDVGKIIGIGEYNARTHTVRNMGWVNLFAWILPIADPGNAVEYRSVGAVMATIMLCGAVIKRWPTDDLDKFRFLLDVANGQEDRQPQ